MYQALYRKWRPRTFDDVVGQAQVTETLKNQVITGRLSHAYLFIGTRGTGKTSCAKILAKAVNCEHPENGNPCNKCKSCMGIDDGSVMDVVELDAASNNGVDNVRALRDEAIFSPAIVKKRVYIIDEVHMLSTSAFNALLKILEEPPEHLMFILATTELQKVPATILSRCQRHSFKRLDPVSLAKRISYVAERENMKLEPNAAELLARLADGSMRDGLSLLDQCSGFENITAENVLSAMGLAGKLKTAELLDNISSGDTRGALSAFSAMWNDGKAPATLLGEISGLMRDVLMTMVAPGGGSALLSGGYDRETLDRFAKRMTREELICGMDSIQAHIGALRDGRDPKTTAELCIIELCEPRLGDGIDTLKERVAKLEELVKSGSIFNEDRIIDKSMVTVSETDNHPAAPETADEPEKLPPTAETEREEPMPAGEPVPESTAVQEQTGDVLKNILSVLKGSMQAGNYNIISGCFLSGSVLEGNILTIAVPNTFVRGQFENAQNLIRDASEKVTGRTIAVRIIENKARQGASPEKLDVLSKFGNVKFE